MDNGYFIILYIVFSIFIVLLQGMRINQLKNRIREEERIKREIYEIGDEISLMDCKQDIYDYILESTMKIIKKGNKGSIILMQGDGTFRYTAIKGFEKELVDEEFKIEEVYKYNKFREGAVINVISEIGLSKKDIREYAAKIEDGGSILAAPIKCSGELIGIIRVESLSSKIIFNDDDINAMRCIKSELELAIKNLLIREELKYSATYDELTKLYNRRNFNKLFKNEIKKINEDGGVSHFAIIDLDDFKSVNDNYGHSEGDRALCKMAEGMKRCLGKDETYARMSGDEFVIIFRNISFKEAENKLDEIRKYLKDNYHKVKLDFTYGMVEIEEGLQMQQDEVFAIADRRLYEAKREKKVGR